MSNYQSSLPPRSERHTPKKKKNKSFKSEFYSTLLYVMILSFIFFLVHQFLYAPVMVDGDSMEPTLSNGDYLMLNKISKVERFDIVVFPPPEAENNDLYIKRVIGLPGDEIEYEDDILYLNGEKIDESFLDYSLDDEYYSSGSFTLSTLLGEVEVPDGSYFVLGDNRLNSRDSRSFGFVDEESVIGKISLRYWPLDKVRRIKNELN